MTTAFPLARRALLAALLLLASCNPTGTDNTFDDQPWRTSWSAFAMAVDQFRTEAERANPDSPEFPQAGRQMLYRGETTPTTWPVMRRFHGLVEFEGRLEALETDGEVLKAADNLMPGQPFKIKIDMTEEGVPGFAVTHIYPRAQAVTRWREIAPGTVVRFRSRISGISAMGMGGRYMYFVLLTDAEPVDAS